MSDDTIKSPQDMRRRLQEIAARGSDPRIEPGAGPQFATSIVASCLRSGRYEGWSGEDTYTILAWQLLNLAQRFGRMYYEQMLNEKPRFVVSGGHISLPIETAPKNRPILLLVPEPSGHWPSGWWRGSWSQAKGAWGLHLPSIVDGEGKTEMVEGIQQPTHWTDLPPCP